MARPRKKSHTLKEQLLLIKKAGLNPEENQGIEKESDEIELEGLPERIQKLLNIIKSQPIKPTDMLAILMYDIEDNKVRTLIAKYLIEKGCIRIQKSVYILKTQPKEYKEIIETLKEVQEVYENNDSIIAVPIPLNTPGSMQIIGKEIQIDTLVNNPNTLFF